MASDDDDKAKASQNGGDGEPEAKKAKVAAPEQQTNAAGETFFNLSNKRRVTIRSYNKMALIDIREFYGENDDKPGKKGISLSVDQFEKLKELVAGGEIDEALKKLNKE